MIGHVANLEIGRRRVAGAMGSVGPSIMRWIDERGEQKQHVRSSPSLFQNGPAMDIFQC